MRTCGGVSWLVAIGLAVGMPVVAATPVPVVSAVPYQADSGSVAVQCGKLIDGVAAQAQGLATVIILIAVKGDPLADVTRLQDVAAVIKGGLAFKLPAE